MTDSDTNLSSKEIEDDNMDPYDGNIEFQKKLMVTTL